MTATATKKTAIKTNDIFYLRHRNGQYLVSADKGRYYFPQLDNTGQVKLQIKGRNNNQQIKDGDIIKICSQESVLGKKDILGAFANSHNCYYWKDGYDDKKQGWQIHKVKSDGGVICYGDAVYITNLSYKNQRLAADTRYHGYITTKKNSTDYWIIESIDNNKPAVAKTPEKSKPEPETTDTQNNQKTPEKTESDNPKDLFIYASDVPTYDSTKELPSTVQPTRHWEFNFYMSAIGLKAVKPLLTLPTFTKGHLELSGVDYLSPNLTRLRPDKYSDEFFVERRLNGFNPGQFQKVENQPWQYIIRYEFKDVKVDENGILPQYIEARFCLDGQKLNPHSIEYLLYDETETQNYKPGDRDWEWSKKLFRNAEFVSHELRSHLGATHLNMDQYAMAYYRNIDKNPIKQLLDPHFEGLLKIDQEGINVLIGNEAKEGKVPSLTCLNYDDTQRLLKEGLKYLTYRNWSPRKQTLPDYVENNYFDTAAITMWNIFTEYVKNFCDEHQQEIQEYWSEIEAMSDDLSSHSILKPELGTLDIKNMSDLREMCIYIIYTCTFQHSWVNNKQYEDGGDVEYATLGMWKNNNDPAVAARNAQQVITLWNLTDVRYNLIMDMGPVELKNALWENR
ncbi:MAG: lipoxygenase family protein, partial [Cyanobacteriota bacterium]|nr:lipoxygenase family protein [Cyanobacteriota bacterium]